MNNLIVMGECMLELSTTPTGQTNKSFGGDVYNTAVYYKRLMQQQGNVGFFTAVGEDNISQQMVAQFQLEQLNTEYVFTNSDKTIGAYMIETSAQGERSFTFWRNDSAARFMMADSHQLLKAMDDDSIDTFYFSGISLAILYPQHRTAFWQLLAELKQRGAKIAFDTNYRPKLWLTAEDALEQFKLAFAHSDIVFTGVEDMSPLIKSDDANQLAQYCAQFDIAELIVKNEAKQVICLTPEQRYLVDVIPASNVVDSTAAGDSFNGAYLAARAKGYSISNSAAFACEIAKSVLFHRGAIMAQDSFDSCEQVQAFRQQS